MAVRSRLWLLPRSYRQPSAFVRRHLGGGRPTRRVVPEAILRALSATAGGGKDDSGGGGGGGVSGASSESIHAIASGRGGSVTPTSVAEATAAVGMPQVVGAAMATASVADAPAPAEAPIEATVAAATAVTGGAGRSSPLAYPPPPDTGATPIAYVRLADLPVRPLYTIDTHPADYDVAGAYAVYGADGEVGYLGASRNVGAKLRLHRACVDADEAASVRVLRLPLPSPPPPLGPATPTSAAAASDGNASGATRGRPATAAAAAAATAATAAVAAAIVARWAAGDGGPPVHPRGNGVDRRRWEGVELAERQTGVGGGGSRGGERGISRGGEVFPGLWTGGSGRRAEPRRDRRRGPTRGGNDESDAVFQTVLGLLLVSTVLKWVAFLTTARW
ncbi:hypothetical protein MMPV_005961 [Pyropia vietnamensis]